MSAEDMKRYKEVADTFIKRIESRAELSEYKKDFYLNELEKWDCYADRMESRYFNGGKCSGEEGHSFGAAHYVANRVRFGIGCCLVNLHLDRIKQNGRKDIGNLLGWRVDF